MGKLRNLISQECKSKIRKPFLGKLFTRTFKATHKIEYKIYRHVVYCVLLKQTNIKLMIKVFYNIFEMYKKKIFWADSKQLLLKQTILYLYQIFILRRLGGVGECWSPLLTPCLLQFIDILVHRRLIERLTTN